MADRRALDHALSVAKAGIEAIPLVGGPIASLLGDYLPNATERNLKRGMALFEEKLRAIERRVDEQVDPDEFAELFKSCFLIWQRAHSEAKLRGASNVLAHLLLRREDPQKVPYSELDHYVHALESLSTGAIEVLGHLYSRAGTPISGTVPFRPQATSFEAIIRDLPQHDPSLLMGLIGELDRFNLVLRREPPSIHREGYLDYSVTLTPLGVRFCEHVLSA